MKIPQQPKQPKQPKGDYDPDDGAPLTCVDNQELIDGKCLVKCTDGKIRVGTICKNKCLPGIIPTDIGHGDEWRGWYDVTDCGKKNRYCRWIGGTAGGGDPSINVRNNSDWACTTPDLEYAEIWKTGKPWTFTKADKAPLRETLVNY